MIPRTIHYCWFGKGEKPELVIKCIESWKKNCFDYEIHEWNEDNFDINQNLYVKQAYDQKKYAFVTDYVRLHALLKEGGIYLDTDVMILKPLDVFLEDSAFACFESKTKINTGLIGSEKNHPLISDFLSYYKNKSFINENGYLDMTTNVETITNILSSKTNFNANGNHQVLDNFTVYPKNFFCPDLKKITDTTYMSETYAIHFFAGSWKSDKTKRRESSLWWKTISKPGQIISKTLYKLFGNRWTRWKNTIREMLIRD